jgi:hypothetical protein
LHSPVTLKCPLDDDRVTKYCALESAGGIRKTAQTLAIRHTMIEGLAWDSDIVYNSPG